MVQRLFKDLDFIRIEMVQIPARPPVRLKTPVDKSGKFTVKYLIILGEITFKLSFDFLTELGESMAVDLLHLVVMGFI